MMKNNRMVIKSIKYFVVKPDSTAFNKLGINATKPKTVPTKRAMSISLVLRS